MLLLMGMQTGAAMLKNSMGDLIIEFDNMFSSASKIQGLSWVLSLDSYTLNQSSSLSDTESYSFIS